ncbi:MAG: hypothetical protein ACODAD_09080 [Planctomycetota bacterium]
MAIITNQMLTELVRDLGFESGELTEKENRFWHHPDGTTIVLPSNRNGSPATQADVLTLRGHLDRKGLMEAARFDEVLGVSARLFGHVPI